MNILVIDDEVMILEMMKKALGRLKHHVDIAENAAKGIAKFDSGSYDLVITDVRMPGIDGEAVVHHIRRSKRDATPVIGVSGTPWLLGDCGFDEVLHKPFTLHTLIEKTKRLTRA